MYGSASRTGVANLPLHYGKSPPWLFQRMSKLAREITIFIVADFGPTEMLRRVSDPCWFQAFGCVLGYDWHGSGVTTTVCGALNDGIPFPVNRKTYDQSIEILARATAKAKIDSTEKKEALSRLDKGFRYV